MISAGVVYPIIRLSFATYRANPSKDPVTIMFLKKFTISNSFSRAKRTNNHSCNLKPKLVKLVRP
jgi:hypothetical protein